MGLFESKPTVGEGEFKDVVTDLYQKGLTSSDVKKVKQVFRGDLNEPREGGIDAAELKRAVGWMKKNRTLSEQKINLVEARLKKRL